MNKELDDDLGRELRRIEDKGRLRQLSTHHQGVDFTSNDYLGLARDQDLANSIREKLERLGFRKNGSTGSRLLSGNTTHAQELEAKLSRIFRSESTLLLNSGYVANLAVLSALPSRGDTIIYDEHSHASIKDGARLSQANRWHFRHNDLEDLEKKLKTAKGKKWIVAESIYSMNGHRCPLQALVILGEKYGARIILDEAHSTGVLGDGGNGLANALGLEKRIDLRIYTFGKAMGVHGACVSGSAKTIEYLVNFSRPFMYTTALPDHSLISIDASFDFLAKNKYLQEHLRQVVDSFTQRRKRSGLSYSDSETQIQAIMVPGNDSARQVAGLLQAQGFDVRPILSPTVEEGHEQIRISLHTYNQDQEVESLLLALDGILVHK